ncbi:MFS transporter, partial [Erwinia amylovora]|nr:MFS transporter [Erwinia amylovora]
LVRQTFACSTTILSVSLTGELSIDEHIAKKPAQREEKTLHLTTEISALKKGKLWMSLLMSMSFAASMISLINKVAPILIQVTCIR